MTSQRFEIGGAKLERASGPEDDIWLGNVVEESSGSSLTVGFGHYGPGESNSEVLRFEEAVTVIRGELSVCQQAGTTTAGLGEILFVPRDADVTWVAGPDGADFTYVTYPNWRTT